MISNGRIGKITRQTSIQNPPNEISLLLSHFRLDVESNQGCSGSSLFCHVIGPENLRPPPNQSDAKLKTIATFSFAFSRASSSLLILIVISHWRMTV